LLAVDGVVANLLNHFIEDSVGSLAGHSTNARPFG
jgi:hypothetical protein